MTRVTPLIFLLACGDSVSRTDAGGPVDGGGTDTGSPCGAIGATRTMACGNCGEAVETCAATGWTAAACTGEGECAAGTVETEDLPMCAQRSRTCTAECTWGAFTESRPPGECSPGETTLSRDGCEFNLYRNASCTEACMWEAGACEDLCPGDARPDEVCIPAGRFYRGDEAYDDATPVELVEITSSFYIMRWPYTMGEFVADVESGRIENRVQESLDVFSGFEERPRAPIAGIYGFYGDEICRVTRGGRLPTEAEWEYAARGPAPSMRPYAWGDERDRCDVYVHAGCPGYVPPDPVLGSVGQYNVPFDADAMPETASWFGVELMVLGVYESVADAYAPDYYREPDSLADPLLTHEDCRARIGLGRCVIEHFRGAPIHAPSDERRLSNRRTEFHDERAETRPIWLRQLGLRCVRDAE